MQLHVDPADLRPIVAAVVEELQSKQPILPERLAFPEGEAAALCGLQKHILRDARLRGEIRGKLVGKKIVYSRDELVRFVKAGK